jgi:hypothetical protein
MHGNSRLVGREEKNMAKLQTIVDFLDKELRISWTRN